MSESISSTLKHSGLTLDSVFVEVQHSEGLGLPVLGLSLYDDVEELGHLGVQ